jgi:hypothetical protein
LCPGIFGTLLAQNAVFGCVPVSKKKIGSSFRRIELNTVQIFLSKMYPFSILDFGSRGKKKKKAKKPKKVLTYTTKNLA